MNIFKATANRKAVNVVCVANAVRIDVHRLPYHALHPIKINPSNLHLLEIVEVAALADVIKCPAVRKLQNKSFYVNALVTPPCL